MGTKQACDRETDNANINLIRIIVAVFLPPTMDPIPAAVTDYLGQHYSRPRVDPVSLISVANPHCPLMVSLKGLAEGVL